MIVVELTKEEIVVSQATVLRVIRNERAADGEVELKEPVPRKARVRTTRTPEVIKKVAVAIEKLNPVSQRVQDPA